MFDLSGKCALVTGASGGIGSSIARALAAQGATLALSGSNEEKLKAFAAELGGDHKTIVCNLSDPASVDALVPQAVEALGGKVDMIPGRVNELVLEPTETGTFRGACAEYCGTSHALMNFAVVVMPREASDQWLAEQAEPAQQPAGELQQAGQQAFLANGCGACHQVRGTEADGAVGPDLTHVGSRLTLAAGTLPADVEAFKRWIGHSSAIKPDVKMPAFGMLPEAQLTAMAHYLKGLE